jgi:hypothetical protein
LVINARSVLENSPMMRARVPVGVFPETWKVSRLPYLGNAWLNASLCVLNNSARWMLLWNETAWRMRERLGTTMTMRRASSLQAIQ